MVICVFQPQHLVKRIIAEAKGVSDVFHYSPNIVDLTVQLIELKRELFYFSPSNYIAQFVEVRDAELAKQSDNLFTLIINFIRTLPTFIRTCADECGNPIP